LGLVSKRVNAKDKRRVLLRVSTEGRKLLNKLVTVQAPVNDALFDTLTPEEFAPLRSMMARLVPCAARSLALSAYLTGEKADTGWHAAGAICTLSQLAGGLADCNLVDIIVGRCRGHRKMYQQLLFDRVQRFAIAMATDRLHRIRFDA
jgi:hypothetical protein